MLSLQIYAALCVVVIGFDMCVKPLLARKVNGRIEFCGGSRDTRASFNLEKKSTLRTIEIPCGQCYECRLKRSREWAIRGVHESQMHKDNCFLTLTYDDDHLVSPSLIYKHFSDFLKRLRYYYPHDKFSYMVCGEYGETNPCTGIVDGGLYRPHFHCILFGFNFPDRVPVKYIGQSDLMKSKELDKIWGYGACRIGEVTFESISYVARYIMKKITGDKAKEHYTIITSEGEMIERVPEMFQVSRRPAIGKRWFQKYGKDVIHHDKTIARGKEVNIPRYYDKQIPKVILGMLQRDREEKGRRYIKDHTDSRDKVRETIVKAGLNQFKRK